MLKISGKRYGFLFGRWKLKKKKRCRTKYASLEEIHFLEYASNKYSCLKILEHRRQFSSNYIEGFATEK